MAKAENKYAKLFTSIQVGFVAPRSLLRVTRGRGNVEKWALKKKKGKKKEKRRGKKGTRLKYHSRFPEYRVTTESFAARLIDSFRCNDPVLVFLNHGFSFARNSSPIPSREINAWKIISWFVSIFFFFPIHFYFFFLFSFFFYDLLLEKLFDRYLWYIYICKIHMYKNRGSFVRTFQAQVQNSPNIYIFFSFLTKRNRNSYI